MANDLRIVDAPEIPSEEFTSEVKIPTGGKGNYSVTAEQISEFVKVNKDLTDKDYVDTASNGVKQLLENHKNDKANPHAVNKAQIGLGNVNNTADLDKPVSNATSAAIITATQGKADKTYVDAQDALKVNKTDLGTASEYNFEDLPISSAQKVVNKLGGVDYWVGGTYPLNGEVRLDNGDIVKSTVPNNTKNPNLDMTGWVLPKSSGAEVYVDDYLTKAERDLVINSDLAQILTFNWSPVFERAIQDLKSKGGGVLRFKFRKQGYLINGITRADGTKVGIMIPWSGFGQETISHQTISLIGETKGTKLYAGESDMEIIRYCASFGEIGKFTLLGTGKTKVKGLQLVPENSVLAKDLSQQSFNSITDITMREVYEGLTLQCGGIGSAYYNHVANVTVNYSGRAFHLKTGVPSNETPQSSNANRNVFVNCRGQIVRVGWHIEAGETNKFFGCGTEGAYSAGGDQLDEPTALQIDNRDKNNRWTNHGNMFYGFTAEACIRDLYLYNPNTSFYGFTLDALKSYVTPDALTNASLVMSGSSDVTVFPNIQDGQMFLGANAPAGIASLNPSYGLRNYNSLGLFDGDGSPVTATINLANSQNVLAIADIHSRVSKFNGYADFSARFTMSPTAADAMIGIKLPFTPNAGLYTDLIGNEQMGLFNVAVFVVGVGYVSTVATLNTTHINVRPPTGGWNMTTGERYNIVHINIRYLCA